MMNLCFRSKRKVFLKYRVVTRASIPEQRTRYLCGKVVEVSLFQRDSQRWDFFFTKDLLWVGPDEACPCCCALRLLCETASRRQPQSRRSCTSLWYHISPLCCLHRLSSPCPLSSLVIINSCMIQSCETVLHFRHKNQLWEVHHVCRKSKH